jgi:hypothetical protein
MVGLNESQKFHDDTASPLRRRCPVIKIKIEELVTGEEEIDKVLSFA